MRVLLYNGKEDKIKISIIISCNKVEKKLPRCLDSLVHQTLEEIEIIYIMMDHRTDLKTGKLYSREMCKKTGKTFDMRKNPEGILSLNGVQWNKIYKARLLKEMDELPHPPKYWRT